MKDGAAAFRNALYQGAGRQTPPAVETDSRTKLLLVDDDPELRELIADYLARHGYAVATAHDGVAMDESLAAGGVDLVILDLMLPGEDGLAIANRLKRDSDLPIIILSACGEDADRIAGLEVGADDYLGKPFNPRELLARIRAVLRRVPDRRDAQGVVVEFGEFVLDFRAYQLTRRGSPVPLTSAEYDLLCVMARHPNEVLDRDAILGALNGMARTRFDRSIDVRITRLRSKIEPPTGAPRFIRTVWGKGYMFCPDAA